MIISIQSGFFFRIKRQTRTRPIKTFVIVLMPNKLRACICLSNMYTTHTRVVTPFRFLKWAILFCFLSALAKTCTCCVWLVYVLDKHIHALKLFGTQSVISRFLPPCTCLAFNSKKKFTCGLSSLCFSFVSGSLLIRFKSVPNSLQVRSLEWEKNGICIGFARELHGSSRIRTFGALTDNTKTTTLKWGSGFVNRYKLLCDFAP